MVNIVTNSSFLASRYNHRLTASTTYEIQGGWSDLRALAVLPIILFHARFEMFSGKFVDIDKFFVY